MSKEEDKVQHSKRIRDTETKVKKQTKIAKSAGQDVKQPHRFAKHHAIDCGNPHCFLCGNPRKLFKELTHQEKKFIQTEKWYEDNV